MRSVKGQLLLDGGKLAGSEFHRTVVLVCEHNDQGAFGLVLNRPSPVSVGAVLAAVPAPLEDLALYIGGPVQERFLSVLLQDPETREGILPGLRLVHELEQLQDAAADQVKFFAGYAGWAPGQLDNELQQQAWLTQPASLETVFAANPDSLWKRILRELGPQYRLLAETPENISWN